MKGLELSEKFYYEHGEKVFKENFADVYHLLAFGLAACAAGRALM